MKYFTLLLLFFSIGFFSTTQSQSKGFETIKNLEIIDLIYKNLDKYFVDEPQIGEITKVGIDAMLAELDPYTVYYHESNIEDYRLMTTGQYGGIGALIRKIDNYVVIAEPYLDLPAYNAGLKAGDIVLSINGKDMKDQPTDVVSESLKGPKGSTVELKIDRPGVGEKKIKITRDEIKLPDIPYSGMIDEEEKIGYIRLTQFTNTASRNVIKAYEELEEAGMKKLVFDLRGNGGGLLIEAIRIVNMFVPKGVAIVETKGRIVDENRVYKTENKPTNTEIPLVVLIDEMSASASEIVSGSLQDLDRAVVVGQNSFGKGLVQRTVDLEYGAKMKLTISKYYTPSGRCVQKMDYYHKNDGKIDEVPDSLITIFYTKNGREVIDGRGIEPDVKIENEENLSKLAAVLMTDNMIFNYATEFANKVKEIAAPEEFEITQEIYDDFKDYVLTHDLDYKSNTQIQLEKVLETAKKEGYDKKLNGEYEALENVLKVSTASDLELFSDQIKEILVNEIVSRYYFQEGRVLNAFKYDKTLEEAINVLKDTKRYQKILKP